MSYGNVLAVNGIFICIATKLQILLTHLINESALIDVFKRLITTLNQKGQGYICSSLIRYALSCCLFSFGFNRLKKQSNKLATHLKVQQNQ